MIILFISSVHLNELGPNLYRSVLYGNDIKKGNAIKIPVHLRKNDFLVINNEKNEICAIARSLVNKQDLASLNAGENIALNLVDKGYYLRKIQ